MIKREELKKRLLEKLKAEEEARRLATTRDQAISEEKAKEILDYVDRQLTSNDPWDRGYTTPRERWWCIHNEEQWMRVLFQLETQLRELRYVTKIVWSDEIPHYGRIYIKDPLS